MVRNCWSVCVCVGLCECAVCLCVAACVACVCVWCSCLEGACTCCSLHDDGRDFFLRTQAHTHTLACTVQISHVATSVHTQKGCVVMQLPHLKVTCKRQGYVHVSKGGGAGRGGGGGRFCCHLMTNAALWGEPREPPGPFTAAGGSAPQEKK